MSTTLRHLEQVTPPEIATTIRNAGLAGAGGAGFPSYAKWERLEEVPSLLVNHQESEPNYYIDKWLGKTHADEFAMLFDALLDRAFELIVVCAKKKDREEWVADLEAATDATVYLPDDLPLEPEDESGVVVAYTDDRYEYGMESVLLRLVAGVTMGNDLPMDHGWIVQNTETMFNLYETFDEGAAMTRKLVHVDGSVPEHRFLDVPVGTTAADLLRAAGRPPSMLDDDEVLVDGGPGWCFEIADPTEFGVRKRTNCVLVLEEETVADNTLGEGRVNVLSEREWAGGHETAPSPLHPDAVRIPLVTNPAFEGVVSPSRPIVEEGDEVEIGEMIAVPDDEGISNAQHASIDGTVVGVTDDHVTISAASEDTAVWSRELDHGQMVYWTWCDECGSYVARPEFERVGRGAAYVCRDCR